MDEWRHRKEQTVRVGTGDERACGEVVEVRTRDEAEELSLRQLRVNESLIIGQSLGWLIRTLGHSWRLRHLCSPLDPRNGTPGHMQVIRKAAAARPSRVLGSFGCTSIFNMEAPYCNGNGARI